MKLYFIFFSLLSLASLVCASDEVEFNLQRVCDSEERQIDELLRHNQDIMDCNASAMSYNADLVVKWNFLYILMQQVTTERDVLLTDKKMLMKQVDAVNQLKSAYRSEVKKNDVLRNENKNLKRQTAALVRRITFLERKSCQDHMDVGESSSKDSK